MTTTTIRPNRAGDACPECPQHGLNYPIRVERPSGEDYLRCPNCERVWIDQDPRPLYAIAREIRADWKRVNYGAEPYLRAMADLQRVSDNYGCDSAASIIRYFLANATTWRGETARRIKSELKSMLSRVRR